MKAIVYSKAALKTLGKIPRNTSARIVGKIEAYAASPESQTNNVTKLQDYEGIIRLRVGDWRVIMEDDKVIDVIKIAPRGRAYEN